MWFFYIFSGTGVSIVSGNHTEFIDNSPRNNSIWVYLKIICAFLTRHQLF